MSWVSELPTLGTDEFFIKFPTGREECSTHLARDSCSGMTSFYLREWLSASRYISYLVIKMNIKRFSELARRSALSPEAHNIVQHHQTVFLSSTRESCSPLRKRARALLGIEVACWRGLYSHYFFFIAKAFFLFPMRSYTLCTGVQVRRAPYRVPAGPYR